MGSYLYKLIKTFSRRELLIMSGAIIVFIVTGTIYLATLIDKKTVLIPDYGGTYREGLLTQPVYINPVISNVSDADKDLIALTFSSVFQMAERITSSTNHRSWTIRLKDNIYWHDGAKLTADDIIFTLKAIQNPETGSPQFITWQGVKAERVSELELTFVTGAPYAFFEENLKGLYAMPKHIFDDVPVTNWRRSDYSLEPVGNGPYRVASFKKEKNGFISEYYLEKFSRYFSPEPLIDNLTFVFFKDATAAVNAFNIGHIDALSGLDPNRLREVIRPHELANLRLPRYYAVFLNQSSNELLKNLAVRHALNYAVNKQDIIEKVFKKNASALDGPTPFIRELALNDETLYDPGKAEALLEKSGPVKGADGFRGEIKLVVPNLEFLTKTAKILKSNWEAVGIKTTLVIEEPVTINSDTIKSRNYDAVLFGNIFATNPDMFSFWHSSERFYPGLNLSLYNNKSADRLMESIREDFDMESRNKTMADLVSLIRVDQPAIFLYSPNYIYLLNGKAHGFDESIINIPSSRFQNVAKWYINTKRVFR